MTTCGACGAQVPEGAAACPACGAARDIGAVRTVAQEAAPDLALAPGQVFAGRYLVEAQIGEGGMGAVWRARDRVTSDAVALKVIRPARGWTPAAVEQLVREGSVARKIRHPGVVSVYDVGLEGGRPFITMELLEGESLRAWMRRRIAAGRDCPYPAAAAIVLAICEGLAAAHALGVTHRDLKPENVFLLGDPEAGAPRVKILDFGLARLAAEGAGSSGSSGGTPLYMAPEQKTSPEAALPSADVYSLSVMFYELLVDATPHGVWQPPSAGRSDVPAAADDLIFRGVSNRPRSRPQTAEELRALVEATLGPPAKVRPVKPKAEAPPKAERPSRAAREPMLPKLLASVGNGVGRRSPAPTADAAAPAPAKRGLLLELLWLNGRIGRVRFFLRVIVAAALLGLAGWMQTSNYELNGGGAGSNAAYYVAIALLLLALWLIFTAVVQRLHDLKLTGFIAVAVVALFAWLAVAGTIARGSEFIPGGLLALSLGALLFMPGEPHDNRFGAARR